MQQSSLLLDEIKAFLVAAQKAGEEVEAMAKVLLPLAQTVPADALLTIEAQEV